MTRLLRSIAVVVAACLLLAARADAAAERTLKARLIDVDASHLRLRADVAGRAATYAVANERLLRGFRKGDLVLLRLRGRTVFDMRLAILTAQVVAADDASALLRLNGHEERFLLARKSLRGQLHKGDFVRLEVEERSRGVRVITRVY